MCCKGKALVNVKNTPNLLKGKRNVHLIPQKQKIILFIILIILTYALFWAAPIFWYYVIFLKDKKIQNENKNDNKPIKTNTLSSV